MSAGQVYDRWFITPPVSGDGMTVPKYWDAQGVVAYSGNLFKKETIKSGGYNGLIDQYPEYDEWYIVRMYGTGTSGWDALNQIHNYQDTRTLTDHENDVAPIMNGRFGVGEWEFSCSIGGGN